MNINFLILTNKGASVWLEATHQALTPFGDIEVRTPEEVEYHSNHDVIIIDAAAAKDPVALVKRVRLQNAVVPILVATNSRNWKRTRSILLEGATDCILKSMTKFEWATKIANLPGLKNVNRNEITSHVAPAKPKATILMADNDLDFLATRKEILERAGYLVITATTPAEASEKFGIGGIDLAILDIRLTNDDDERDTSGLQLAKRAGRSVPKIIMTNFPNFDFVRESLRPQLDDLKIAVDFIAKSDGIPILLTSIEDILTTVQAQQSKEPIQSKIFIAHGHDSAIRDSVSVFLRETGNKPIVLFEEADRGETIIEKLERCCREADFAIVLFTRDDIGYSKQDPQQIRPRARQNVIFELGYLVARLGRRRVRVLYEGDVEIPTNFMGVLYIEMDEDGRWKKYLEREMKDAGIFVKEKA